MRRTTACLLATAALVATLVLSAAPSQAQSSRRAAAVRGEKADRNGDKIFDDLADQLATADPAAPVDVIVVLDGKVDSARVRRLQDRIGAFATGQVFDVAHGFSAQLSPAQVDALAKSADVVQVELDSPVHALNTKPQTDFGVTEVRTVTGADGADASPGCQPSDQVVAVIDTGIDGNHPMLAGKVMAFHDWVSNAGNAVPPYDDNGHGTHVAGTIAGVGAEGGVAPGACLIGLKVLDAGGSGSMSNVNAAINWAVANKATYGIDVINLSLGTSGCANGTDSTSQAVNAAIASDLVVAIAAGNSGPAACTVGSPGAAASAITVAAMADLGQQGFALASFSSRGGAALPNKPDVAAPGVSVVSAAANTTGLKSLSGTSMATPFVAGVAALMRDVNPSLTAAQVKSAILATAIDWGSAGKDTEYGAGRLDGFAAVANAAGSAVTPASTPQPQHTAFSATLGPTGAVQDHVVNVTNTSLPLAATLIHTGYTASSASTPDLDLYVLDPSGVEVGRGYTSSRQETVKVTPSRTGNFIVRVKSYNGTGAYQLDISAGATTALPPPPLPPPPSTVKLAPASVAKITGGAPSGNAASLAADDNNYFQVPAYRSVVEWTATFQGIPANATNVTLTLKSKNSRNATQTLTTNWSATVLDTRSVSTAEILVQKAVTGAVANTLTVRVRTTAGKGFTNYGDFLELSYQIP